MAFFTSASSSSSSAKPHAGEENCSSFSVSCKSTGSTEYKTIRIFGVSIDIPIGAQSRSLDFMGVNETTPTMISLDSQIAAFQPRDLAADHRDDYWTIRKILHQSDVDGSARLLLGKKMVRDHVLPHIAEFDGERGTELVVYDVDTRTEHTLTLKTWKTTSFILMKGWTKDFVRKRELSKDDEIGLRWEENDQRFEFAVLRQAPKPTDFF